MSETKRPAPFFIADNRALDFLNSICAPWSENIEWIGDGHDLLDWLNQAELIPVDISVLLRKEIPTEELDKVARQARSLREWFRDFITSHTSSAFEPSTLKELETLNELLARDDLYRQIEVNDLTNHDLSGDQFVLRWQQKRRWRTAEDLLLPIAEAIGNLICGVDFSNVKNCEGPTCSLWFHDISKNHTRRWCSMAVCGNRAKAAAHRAKKKR